MKNPISAWELAGYLRNRRGSSLLVGFAAGSSFLVLLFWPTDARVDVSGARAQQVFRVFGYGLLTMLLLFVPAFPATSIVRERNRGTLALLLNSPLRPWSIYFGKLVGVLGFVLLLLAMSMPAAAALTALGGVTVVQVARLYGLLVIVALQYVALGLLVSARAASTDGALRTTYGLVLLMAIVAMGPYFFVQGQSGSLAQAAAWLRSLSPVPATMELLSQAGIGAQGFIADSSATSRYAFLACLSMAAFVAMTIARLNHRMFDRSRSQGIITDDRHSGQRLLRRLLFLVDPQRRKKGIAPFLNPVMVKEFRCRRFGRLHWLLRLVAACALVSLGLTYFTTAGTVDWGVELIGGIMVILQVALILLVTPSLAAGLVSGERESGGWQLLQATPLSVGTIVRGKLMSVVWTLVLILLATLPGYLVITYIEPGMAQQVRRVMACLLLTAVFAVALSAAAGSFFRQTAPAAAVSYAALLSVCAGTLLFWVGREAPFGHSLTRAALTINPLAAALSVIGMPGFEKYELVPANWWILGVASACLLSIFVVQTWRLTRPQ